jgi:hypothetical protein
MSDLEELRARLRTRLNDEGSLWWSDTQLDAHLRTALSEIGVALPRWEASVWTLTAADLDGGGIRLDERLGSGRPAAVFYPAEAARPLGGWWLTVGLYGEVLMLPPAAPVAAVGQTVRLIVSAPARLAGLDGALATNVRVEELELALEGAAGSALTLGALARGEVLERRLMRQAGAAALARFRLTLREWVGSAILPGGAWGWGWELPS